MITKTIGKADTNDVIINNPTVSRTHAKISYFDEKKSFSVEDMGSLNGTFVNGYRIQKATITLQDEVKISEVKLDLSKIFKIVDQKPPVKKDELDYIVEFAALENVWNEYQQNRIKVTKKHNLKTSLIRGSFTLGPLVIYGFLHSIIPATQYIVVASLGSTLAIIATGNMSPIEKLTELDEEFKVRYVCPNKKCSRQLGSTPWKTFRHPGYCPACKAKYF